MSEITLDEMNEQEYTDTVAANIGFHGGWPEFIEPHRLRRTRDALENLEASVEGQIERHADDAKPGWLPKANSFRRMVKVRLKQVNRAIHKSESSGVRREQDWKNLAHELALALDDSDSSHRLDDIQAPFGLTAGAWLERRLEKRGLLAPAEGEAA